MFLVMSVITLISFGILTFVRCSEGCNQNLPDHLPAAQPDAPELKALTSTDEPKGYYSPLITEAVDDQARLSFATDDRADEDLLEKLLLPSSEEGDGER